MYQTNPPRRLPKEVLPTMYDLPSEDLEEPNVPDEFYIYQPWLLEETFRPAEYPPEQMFMGTDLSVDYDLHYRQWYKHPHWLAVLEVSRLDKERNLPLSRETWQQEASPLIVVELLSPGTEKENLEQTPRDVHAPPTKWEVYEQILRVPYYVAFNRHTNELQAFELLGNRYQKMQSEENCLWLPEIQLGVGLWSGTYQKIDRQWLRWFDSEVNWLLTTAELEEQERQKAEQERVRAERLAAKLRELGVDPDEV